MSAGPMAGVDAAALDRWLSARLPGWKGPARIELAAGGHSNLTYSITDADGRRYALRRPPLGDLPPGAHDVLREHRILAGLQGTAVPVPPVVAACDDPGVIGAPFYVMAWIDGTIVADSTQLDIQLPVERRRYSALRLVDTLAALHQVDVDTAGLGELGLRDHYLERQLARLHKVWQRTKTRELPIIESLHARLLSQRPPQRHTGLVHSDFRYGNVILGADCAPIAVLDWELCALGDVFVDLGFLLANWDLPDDPWPNVWMETPPTRAGGFPTRDEIVQRYATVTGWDVSDIGYYRAFCLWRIAVIAEGIKRRYSSGALGDKRVDLAVLEQRVRDRAALAEAALDAV